MVLIIDVSAILDLLMYNTNIRIKANVSQLFMDLLDWFGKLVSIWTSSHRLITSGTKYFLVLYYHCRTEFSWGSGPE